MPISEPFVQLGEWINATELAWVVIIAPMFGLISPRLGFFILLLWFCIAGWFV